ncbi:MAG: WxcM-like domain-containing protein [Chloroflexi bacterium]|nr:WxcM-like domain-containing protein [Chloroflexota bacterium]
MTLDNIYWIDLPSYSDTRGVLTAVESEQDIPFAIQRVFSMHHIVADRAAHAHPHTDQVIIGGGRFLSNTGIRRAETANL